jgi:hypothetical protein
MSAWRTAAAGLAGLLVLAVAATAATAADLIVTYDQSQILKLPKPAKEIVIGNAVIADVVVRDKTFLIVTGKSFGITNLIALDEERNVISSIRVIVRRDETRVVNLIKGGKRQSFNCTPQCNPSITVGDDPAYFEQVAKSAQAKISLSEKDGVDTNKE